MGAVRIRYVGRFSDPNFGFHEPELFESIDRARLALELRHRQGFDTSNFEATSTITLSGELEHVDWGVLTNEAKIELWRLGQKPRRVDVRRDLITKEITALEDLRAEPHYRITLGSLQGCVIQRLR